MGKKLMPPMIRSRAIGDQKVEKKGNGVLTEFRPSIWGWNTNNNALNSAGFCWTALDRYFSTGDPPPPVDEDDYWVATIAGTDELVWNKFGHRAKIWDHRPDEGSPLNPWHSVHYLTRAEEWKTVNRRLDDGLPVLICLITRGTPDRFVLAWGYDIQDNMAIMNIYDPNQPGVDDATLNLTLGGNYQCFQTNPDIKVRREEIRGFFYAEYYH